MRREGVWNEAERRPAGRRKLEMDLSDLEPLQPLEIPQNRQSFLWKCLEKNSRVLEKLAIKFWRSPLFRNLRRRSSNGEIGESRLEDLARRSLSFREARPKLPA